MSKLHHACVKLGTQFLFLGIHFALGHALFISFHLGIYALFISSIHFTFGYALFIWVYTFH